MAKKILWSGSTVLPSPVSISVNDQIIWSANTGRSASGSMIGDVVAEKKDVAIKWGILTEAELAAIKKIMVTLKLCGTISADSSVGLRMKAT